MEQLSVWYVDAFTTHPFCGNPAAIVFCESEPRVDVMQAIARETNLSETVFVLPSQDARAHYRARIFTVRREIPFAGHPTMAAAYAVATRRNLLGDYTWPVLRQECGVGLVDITTIKRPYGVGLFVSQRPVQHWPVEIACTILAKAVGCPVAEIGAKSLSVVSTGVPWLIVEVRSLAAIRTLEPDFQLMATITRKCRAVGVTVFTKSTVDPACTAHLRSFAPAEGITEDPVCGSCHGALTAYLLKLDAVQPSPDGAAQSIFFEQGEEIFRPGTAEVIISGASEHELLVGGPAVVTMQGALLC